MHRTMTDCREMSLKSKTTVRTVTQLSLTSVTVLCSVQSVIFQSAKFQSCIFQSVIVQSCNFYSCDFVRNFPLPQCPLLQCCPSFSSPAVSSPALHIQLSQRMTPMRGRHHDGHKKIPTMTSRLKQTVDYR